MVEEKQIVEKKKSAREKGAAMIEYALIAALIAIIAIAAVRFLGQQVSGTFSTIGSDLEAS